MKLSDTEQQHADKQQGQIIIPDHVIEFLRQSKAYLSIRVAEQMYTNGQSVSQTSRQNTCRQNRGGLQ